jgi:hypothetical protein
MKVGDCMKKRIVSGLLSIVMMFSMFACLSGVSPVKVKAWTNSQYNIVDRAQYMWDSTWVCQQNVEGWGGTFTKGNTYRVPYGQPVYQQPAQRPAQQPVYQQPVQQPMYQQPAYQQPMYQQPVQPMQQPVMQPMAQPVQQWQQPVEQPVQPVQQPQEAPVMPDSNEALAQAIHRLCDLAEALYSDYRKEVQKIWTSDR